MNECICRVIQKKDGKEIVDSYTRHLTYTSSVL